jgi:hypothetical protein
MTARWRSRWGVPALLCVVLAILHTWPLASAPHRFSRHDNGDVMLNEWILAWVQHQLPRDPLNLFQANIFHPAPDTLAYSEPLIVPALLGAPVAWLGGSPVLVHNLLVIAGFALSAFAAYAVALSWTGDRLAAFVAASAFAFNTHLLVRLAHVQALHAYGLPLALLAADRLLVHHRTRDAGWLALWLTCMAYTSGHFFVFAAVTIAVAIVTRPGDWVPRVVPVVSRFAFAAALTAAAVVPLYMPYRRVALEQGLMRTLHDVAPFSATLRTYLASAGRVHFHTWSADIFRREVDAFFPGVAVLALTLVAVGMLWRRASEASAGAGPRAEETRRLRRRVVMLVAIGCVGVVLSLGTNTPVYGWVYAVFPPLRAIRAAERFGNLFLLATALLAAFGAARLRTSPALGRHSTAVILAFIVIINAEAFRAPYHFSRFEGIPNVYTLLAREPAQVVLVELPFYPLHAIFNNAEYVLNSTAHWRPIMNGYSGFTPDSYREYADRFRSFPAGAAIQAMRHAGVTHIMVHPQRFERDPGEMQRAIQASSHLERVAVGPREMTLYRLR